MDNASIQADETLQGAHCIPTQDTCQLLPSTRNATILKARLSVVSPEWLEKHVYPIYGKPTSVKIKNNLIYLTWQRNTDTAQR